MSKNIKYLFCIGLFCVISVGIAFSFYFSQFYELEITDRGNGETWCFRLPEREFSLGFTHSVMKTPVEDRYQVDEEGRIYLVETVYQSYGVGLPFLPEEGSYQFEDGLFRLNLNREIEELSLVISPVAQHYLKIGEDLYWFNELTGGESVSIVVSYVGKQRWFHGNRIV